MNDEELRFCKAEVVYHQQWCREACRTDRANLFDAAGFTLS